MWDCHILHPCLLLRQKSSRATSTTTFKTGFSPASVRFQPFGQEWRKTTSVFSSMDSDSFLGIWMAPCWSCMLTLVQFDSLVGKDVLVSCDILSSPGQKASGGSHCPQEASFGAQDGAQARRAVQAFLASFGSLLPVAFWCWGRFYEWAIQAGCRGPRLFRHVRRVSCFGSCWDWGMSLTVHSPQSTVHSFWKNDRLDLLWKPWSVAVLGNCLILIGKRLLHQLRNRF